MNVTFTGKIIAAGQVQMGTSQNGTQWSSCEYVIEELNQQYPSRSVFQVYGSDKLQQFNIQVGEIITAHISLKANQSRTNGRWFNQLDCWKVERPGSQQQQAYTQPVQQNYQQPQTYQSAIGQPTQPQGQQFPPQVNTASQPINQQPQPNGGQQENLPFPPAQ